ncbi:restriction endonuclease subunit S [Enterococcus faecalis]|nr:restriction endonuclease subunit S [Enterococcus faecalis]
MKKAPRLRFRGFQEDWELCKLNNIYKKIRNAFVGTATPYYVKEGNFYLESNNIKDGNINQNTKVFINDEFYEKQKDKWLETEDIVMVQSGHVGHTAVIPKELNNTAAHALIMFQERKRETNPYFLNYQFLTDTSKRKLDMITTGNTIKHILASEMKSFEVFVCESAEENLISDFFRKLDDTIGLHQRKLDQLKELKKAYLQLIIVLNSSENSTVPKLRFANFTGEWELCKLGDELALLKDGTHGTHTDSLVGPYLLSAKNIKNGKINITNEDRKISQDEFDRIHSRFSLKKDDILLTIVGSIGEAAILRAPEGITFQRSVAYLRSKVINPEFLYTYITGPEFQKELKNRQVVSAQPGIYLGDLDKIPILFPKTSREQQKIGTFFQQLDQAITLHQNKLTQLKFLKKSYLQNMFI